MRVLPLVVILIPVLGAVVAVAGDEPKSAAASRSPRALFLARCSACHAADRVAHRAAGRDEWREIVNRMRRMPQSGISPADAEIILDYLASTPSKGKQKRGRARDIYGAEWLSILEVATVRDDRVQLGGKAYEVERAGDTVVLFHGEDETALALPDRKKPAKTLRVDRWTVGKARYEVHIVLYETNARRIRLARALRKVRSG